MDSITDEPQHRNGYQHAPRLIDELQAKHLQAQHLRAQQTALREAIKGNSDTVRDLRRNLTPEDFQDTHTQIIARALWTLYEGNEAYDGPTIGKYLLSAGKKKAFKVLFDCVLPEDEVAPSFRESVHIILNWKKTAASTFTEPETPRRKIVIHDAESVINREPPVPIIDGILYAGTVAQIVGDAASYKSFQGNAIAEAVAGGHDWQGRTTQQMPVLCVVGEGGSGQRQRIKALQIAKQRPCQAQFILEAVQLHRPDDIDALLWAISQLPQAPGLIVIDTLARCFVGGDENSARDAGLFVAGLDRIRATTGATVLVIHHVGKSGDARGSTAFTGAMDTIIEAKRNHDTVTLKCLKQKDAAEFEPFSLVRRVVELGEVDEMGREVTSLIFEPTDAAPIAPEPASKAEATRRQILQVLKNEFPEGARRGEVQRRCESFVGRSTFYKHLEVLADDQKIHIDLLGLLKIQDYPICPIPSDSDKSDG